MHQRNGLAFTDLLPRSEVRHVGPSLETRYHSVEPSDIYSRRTSSYPMVHLYCAYIYPQRPYIQPVLYHALLDATRISIHTALGLDVVRTISSKLPHVYTVNSSNRTGTTTHVRKLVRNIKCSYLNTTSLHRGLETSSPSTTTNVAPLICKTIEGHL